MKKSYIKYITALLLFGSNGIIASKISLESYRIVCLRTGIGTLLLLLIFLMKRQKPPVNKKDILFITLSGMAMGVSWICLYEAYGRIGVSLSSLLYYCEPVIVIVLSPILFKEKLTANAIIGFLTVIFGVFLINADTNVKDLEWFGLLCGGASAVMYSAMVILNKFSKKITRLENSLIQLFASFVTVALFTAVKSGMAFNVPANEWLWIAVLGLVNTGVGCLFYFSSIGNLPVRSVAVLGYLEPLSAVIFSVLLLGETLSPFQVIGAVLITAGAMFSEIKM